MENRQEKQQEGQEKKKTKIAGSFTRKLTRDNFLIVILVGVLLLVIVWPVEDKDGKTQTQSKQWDSETDIIKIRSDTKGQGEFTEADYEAGLASYAAQLEYSLEQFLSTMDGVGKVRVMVTLEDLGESVVEKDLSREKADSQESDSAGGSRKTTNSGMSEETIFDSSQGSSKRPFVKQVLTPRVEGVAVSAQGGANARVAQNITEAIQALFGIEAHKIKIVKMIPQ